MYYEVSILRIVEKKSSLPNHHTKEFSVKNIEADYSKLVWNIPHKSPCICLQLLLGYC